MPFGIVAVILYGCVAASPPGSAPAASANMSRLVPARTAPVAIGSPRLSPSATPISLVGLSANELTSLLGAPAWTRREHPAEVWQYQGTACVLDIYFYEESGTSRVLYVEARDDSARSVTLAACLERIEAERRPNSSS